MKRNRQVKAGRQTTARGQVRSLKLVSNRKGTKDRTGKRADPPPNPPQQGNAQRSRGRRTVGRGVVFRLADLLAACGHRERLRILSVLRAGTGTYQVLKSETGLKAGPLYHHLNQLRMVRLVGLPKRRNIYEITPLGKLSLSTFEKLAASRMARG